MHQSIKLTYAIWLLHQVISSPLIHALTWVKALPGFKLGSLAWEADDLPTELFLHLYNFGYTTIKLGQIYLLYSVSFLVYV